MEAENQEVAQTTEIVVLPQEVQTLTVSLPEKKKAEVETVLSQVFQGTSDWKAQVDAIVVKGVNDTLSISLAETFRKEAKAARLKAEKVFDAKRAEVQARMADDKTEDALWLKSKQITQILFKSIEEAAEFKANYVERFEKEQRDARTAKRTEIVCELSDSVLVQEFENMSDETFELFLKGLKDAKAAREKAAQEELDRIEKEKKEKQLYETRKESILDLWPFLCNDDKFVNFGKVTEEEFSEIKNRAQNEKNAADEAAKKRQEELDKAAALQKRSQDRQSKVMKLGLSWNGEEFAYKDVNFHHTDITTMTDEAFEKAFAGAEKRMVQIKAEEKLMADAAEKEQKRRESLIEAGLMWNGTAFVYNGLVFYWDSMKGCSDEEFASALSVLTDRIKMQKANEAAIAEQKRKDDEAAAALAKASVKDQMAAWIGGLSTSAPIDATDHPLAKDILSKFAGFKKWALGEIEKL